MFPVGPTVDSNTSQPAQGEGAGQGEETDQEKKVGSTQDGNAQPPTPSQPDSAEAGNASQDKETAWQEKTGPSAPEASAHGPTGHPASITMMHPANVFGKQLLEISQTIIRRFLPKDEKSTDHDVCKRFWGSVDEAIRVSTQWPPAVPP